MSEPIPHHFYIAHDTYRCLYCNRTADDCEGEAVCEAAERIRQWAENNRLAYPQPQIGPYPKTEAAP